ncbi:MAG: EF-hand domain-containing protein [Methyloceanibacter sp.]
MRIAALTSLIILLGAGTAFAADTDAGTAGRPSAVLSETDCVAAWHGAAGDELTRFHRDHANLSPANARGIVTNFQQADTDKNGSISPAEFTQACKLGLVTGSQPDRNIAADGLY